MPREWTRACTFHTRDGITAERRCRENGDPGLPVHVQKYLRAPHLCVHFARQGLQLGQDIGLAEREYGIFGVCVELYDHVLDLQWAGDERVCGEGESEEYLIPPEKLITLPVLETVPNIQELSDAVVSYVISIVFCLIPV